MSRVVLGVLSSLALLPAGSQAYDFRAERLAQQYDRWRGAERVDAGAREIVVPLGWFRGMSAERTRARGLAVIDPAAGKVVVEVGGIDRESLGDVWLIDNRPGGKAGALPDASDLMRRIGRLEVVDGYGSLSAEVGAELFRDFDVDRVVVTGRDRSPLEDGVLFGAPSLFDRLARVSWRKDQGLAPIAGDDSSRQGYLASFPGSGVAAADAPGALEVLGVLLDEGENLFENETFDGNGRTCATCHPASNNFTLDKSFIDGLPEDDPLFVAELIPELNHELNGGRFFENPVLMREFAVIVVNADGFDDLTSDYVLRSPNAIFAQALSIQPRGGDSICEGVPPLHRLGWGGDGAPGSGTLREFAIGAVIQHAPLTLDRVEGEDFRLPTDEELDALEAFQLSLGRQEELDLGSMVFRDPDVAAGQDLFHAASAGHCSLCHSNAGANHRVGAVRLENLNFDIGQIQVPHPARDLRQEIPLDDGFGSPPEGLRCNLFNTPSLVEAADTPPFGHANVFATLEEAIAHYGSDEFNERSSAGRALGPITLTDEEVGRLGALLRVVNALRNIEDVSNCHDRVRAAPREDWPRLLGLCYADNEDAIQVLSEGPLAPLHPVALEHLEAALDFHQQAIDATTMAARNAALFAATAEMRAARADMIDE